VLLRLADDARAIEQPFRLSETEALADHQRGGGVPVLHRRRDP
jgi:hypothetical protein